MADWLIYILFVAGFPALIFGADWLVRGAGSVARKLGVSDMVIGLTIVALGTSAPELIVAIMSALNGSADLAIGNVIGSNISNILLILGVASLIIPLKITKNTKWREIPFVLLAVIVLAILANDHIINGAGVAELVRGDGLILLCFFAIFMYYVFSLAKNSKDAAVDTVKPVKPLLAATMIAGGIVGLALGGQWIVDGASLIATKLGMSEAMIGLTIVAIGTSLPELAASIAAARRGNADMAVGNIVGSNILNIFWILGVTATITPIAYNEALNTDIWFLMGVTVLFFIFTYTWKKHKIDRIEGVLFLLLYAAYISFLVWRG